MVRTLPAFLALSGGNIVYVQQFISGEYMICVVNGENNYDSRPCSSLVLRLNVVCHSLIRLCSLLCSSLVVIGNIVCVVICENSYVVVSSTDFNVRPWLVVRTSSSLLVVRAPDSLELYTPSSLWWCMIHPLRCWC